MVENGSPNLLLISIELPGKAYRDYIISINSLLIPWVIVVCHNTHAILGGPILIKGLFEVNEVMI